MLCSSKIHPHILAYDSLNGTFNFDKTLFAPQGTKVIMHEKPMTRRSFAPSGIDSWYVASVFHHFCCQQIYIPKMRGFCIGDTVDFFPYNTTLTPKTVQEQILEQTKALIRLYMQQPSKTIARHWTGHRSNRRHTTSYAHHTKKTSWKGQRTWHP